MAGLNPLGEPLEELESLIPGINPSAPSILPALGNNKPPLYQANGASDRTEPLNLIEPVKEPATSLVTPAADALIVNKGVATSGLHPASTAAQTSNNSEPTNAEIDPLIGSSNAPAKATEDPLTNPNPAALTTDSNSSPDKTPLATALTTDKSEPNKIPTPTTDINFDTNAFVVDSTGTIGIEYKYDGGWYAGDLAIVSARGMEEFVPGSEAFVKEAARRALSNSTLGYIAISDATEAAYYTDSERAENFNSGTYKGIKTFAMNPGDKFFFMLVPNGTAGEVFDNPGIGGDKKPLFSIQQAGDGGESIGQIADITGEGKLFVMEDMGVVAGSDRDYNDIIFKISGVTSHVASLSQFVSAATYSSRLELAQKLIDSGSGEPTKNPAVSDEKEAGKPPSTVGSKTPATGTNATDAVASEPQKTGTNATDAVGEEAPQIEANAAPTASNELPKTEVNIEPTASNEPLKTAINVGESASNETLKTEIAASNAAKNEPHTNEIDVAPTVSNSPSNSEKTVVNTASDAPSNSEKTVVNTASDAPSNSEKTVVATVSDAPSQTAETVAATVSDAPSQTAETVAATVSNPPSQTAEIVVGSVSSETPAIATTAVGAAPESQYKLETSAAGVAVSGTPTTETAASGAGTPEPTKIETHSGSIELDEIELPVSSSDRSNALIEVNETEPSSVGVPAATAPTDTESEAISPTFSESC